ncbi:NACHT domain-containing protein [Streptomyces sp. S.PB5]|uniref:NACHT domain-containing protein n=1 Tax=Streptomyces sp. S.PB5 TaxID=3020844 RepID=UPI0025B0F76A|nr:NACHT domain-containing protein [Streptomyces sp. S.PB5]MDN3025766.1 NACHT domain-containing protein [Streptomyces sp. S.PB5]
MLAEVAAGVLVEAIAGTVRWLRRESVGSDGAEQALIRWFDTYELTPVRDAPGLPDGVSGESVAEFFRCDDSQAVLHELLAARLTDAPEAVVGQLREAYLACARAALPPVFAAAGLGDPDAVASGLAEEFFDHCDLEIATIVGRLAAADPVLVDRVRRDAFSARITAVLGAIERHTRALSLRDAECLAADQAFVGAYRRQAVFAHGSLEPPDFERRRRVPIEALHVSPRIQTYDDHDSPPLDLADLDRLLDRTVLLGDPGCGKSTTCQVLMHRRACDPSSPLPFLVVLRDFAAGDGERSSVVDHIEHRLRTHYQCPAPPGAVDRLLLSGAASVVFDGLDELLDATRRREVTEVVELFSAKYPLAQVLVSSRVVGYDEARLDDRFFECYRLGSFDPEQTEEYVTKWFAQEEGTSEEAGRSAQDFLAGSADLTDLRGNPLMLALMCILYRGTGFIPRSRPEVYEQCAALLFHKWDVRRRIHVELTMSRLVEPALRHVALWLLTEEGESPSVTERELVDRVAEFLDGRGYEARAEAETAARQFVGFCRGRAWVFSEMGTTARGESLYTFTHRTFLEYFAAAQLAGLSDTPEALARRLASRVARQQWDVVGQLAVQMKDRATVDGAERVFTALLDERRRRSTAGRGNVLAFLARCLSCVDPPPRIVRRLTREAVEHLLPGDPMDAEFSGPVMALLTSSWYSRELVADELAAAIADAVTSGDGHRRRTGLLLAAYAAHGVSSIHAQDLFDHWWGFARGRITEYAAEFRAAARDGVGLLDVGLNHGLARLSDYLHNGDLTLSSLFDRWPMGIFSADHVWSPYAFRCLYVFLGNERDSRPLWESTPRDCSTVGAWVREHAQPPWADRPHDVSRPLDGMLRSLSSASREPVAPDALDADGYLGAAVLLLTSLEACSEPPATERLVAVLGPLSDLGPYIAARHTGDDVPLPGLPVPDGYGDLLSAWARRDVDFVRRP